MAKHYLQIDIIKGVAILCVILSHSLPYGGILDSIRMITISQAVPVFFLIMGRNMGASFINHSNINLKNIYTINYFQKRFKRIILPFLVIFIISLVIGILLKKEIYYGFLTLIGQLPITGPGNYFVSIIFQFIFIFPLIFICYKKYPKVTLILTFLVSLLFEVLSLRLYFINIESYLYIANICRYLFLITLGLWALDNFESKKVISKSIIFLSAISFILLLLVSMTHFNIPIFNEFWYNHTMLYPHLFIFAFYPLILYMIGFIKLPENSNNKIIKNIALCGKASYHIFLVQIIFFSIIGNTYLFLDKYFHINQISLVLITLFISFSLNILAGIIFYRAENIILHKIANYSFNYNKFKEIYLKRFLNYIYKNLKN